MRLTCDSGLSFSSDALQASTGEERENSPLGKGLRAAIAQFDVASFPGARHTTWLLANQIAGDAIFLARNVGDPSGPVWLFATLKRTGAGWDVADVGGCAPVAFIADGVRTGTWALDPKDAAGAPGINRFAVAFDDVTCSQGSKAGLARAAVFKLPTGELGLVLGASERPGNWDCPGVPPVRAWVTLPALVGGPLRDFGAPAVIQQVFGSP